MKKKKIRLDISRVHQRAELTGILSTTMSAQLATFKVPNVENEPLVHP